MAKNNNMSRLIIDIANYLWRFITIICMCHCAAAMEGTVLWNYCKENDNELDLKVGMEVTNIEKVTNCVPR